MLPVVSGLQWRVVADLSAGLLPAPLPALPFAGAVMSRQGRAQKSVVELADRAGEHAPTDDLRRPDSGAKQQAEQERLDLMRLQRDARIEAEAAHARFALLAEISQFLLASLDYQAAIMGLTRLVLPALGDACFVDLEEPDAAHRVAIAHIDPHKAALLQKLDQTGGLTRLVGRALETALRTGKPEQGDRVGPQEQPGVATADPESEGLIGTVGPRAYMVIPLVTRGRVLGAMVFLVTESDRTFTADDLDFAQHVARRAATAVDNLRLYEEARQARAIAEDANRLKDEFLATLSHELRTPLNAILGWARMLRSCTLDTITQGKALDIIERNALAQAQIVQGLLDVSRVITGGLQLELQPVDVAGLIDTVVTAVRPAAEAKGLHLEAQLDRGASVVGDPGRLQQVIWNLMSNATKFTPPGGRIDVQVERQDREVVLRVSDTGVGISPSFLPHVFERFRQGDGTTTRVHGGLGLGLAIVRHLAELHGGTVEADSPGIGKGSTFTVRIPVRSAMPRVASLAGRSS
jgi:signal transduction histidine kinase